MILYMKSLFQLLLNGMGFDAEICKGCRFAICFLAAVALRSKCADQNKTQLRIQPGWQLIELAFGLFRVQSQASSFAKQALTFCFHLKWERLQGLLQHMEDRLNFGAEVANCHSVLLRPPTIISKYSHPGFHELIG